MTSLIPSPSVSLIEGRPATTSLAIAEHFGKPHDRVLKDIRNLCGNCPEKFTAVNFDASEYTDSTGRKLPMYTVFFDGFILLVMGYTGKKALGMKLAYIEAFNAMREQLEGKKSAPALESEADRKRYLTRERKRLQREREQLALPTHSTALDEQAQSVQPLMNEVRQRGSEFMSSIFTLQSALRFRPTKMNPAVPDLSKALERTLPQFATSIGMNISALSDLLDVYSATLAATE